MGLVYDISNLCRVKDPCKKVNSEPKKGHLVEFNGGWQLQEA